MKRVISSFFLLLFISITFSSCGVMFGGSKFAGTIIAKDHPDANIYVDGNKLGQGSAVGLFPRNKALTVELRQEGCETRSQSFNYVFRGGTFVATLFMWGLVGVIVDLGTGAAYKPDHKSNPAVQKMSDKNFTFTVTYEGCPTNTSAEAKQ